MARTCSQANSTPATRSASIRSTTTGGIVTSASCPLSLAASAAMAAKLSGQLAEVTIPPVVVDRMDADRVAGVEFACEQVLAIRDSHAFEGVHLIPVSLYRDVAAPLDPPLAYPATTRTEHSHHSGKMGAPIGTSACADVTASGHWVRSRMSE